MTDYEDPTQLYRVTFTHTHFSSYLGWNPTDGSPPPKTKHACLDVGDWCPEQYEEEFV